MKAGCFGLAFKGFDPGLYSVEPAGVGLYDVMLLHN